MHVFIPQKANKGKRFHSAGIKLALEEVEGTQPLYENSQSCLPSCNLCCFLFKRKEASQPTQTRPQFPISNDLKVGLRRAYESF